MRQVFLTIFLLSGCVKHTEALESEYVEQDSLDLLSEDDLEGLPESGEREDED
tara:strand:+ start:143 stop:301 length:159 start_codon:yes stop_codon:yes gene_type:complete